MTRMSATFTAEFRHEFEAEKDRWLQRRFLWYAGILAGWNALKALLNAVVPTGVFGSVGGAAGAARIELGMTAVFSAVFTAAFFYVRGHPLTREQVLRVVWALILFVGVMTIILSPVMGHVAAGMRTGEQTELTQNIAGTGSIFGIMVAHLVASLFIPWTPREAVKPLVPLLAIYAVVTLMFGPSSLWVRVLLIALSPLIAAPGLAVSAWRESRFKDRFHFQMLKGKYGEIKQELASARQIHESLFPPPVREGPVRFEYCYEPMRQIGGDYLFAKRLDAGGRPLLHMAIVDVTGHGITAALTVNRLHGEFERQFGENPQARPGEVLTGLNTYLHHTLASHSVYATAICLRFDPNDGSLSWASAGHPPAFLRTADGRIDRLESTTFVLGATRGDDFIAGEQSARFMPGDMLVLYTDGAIESRNAQGRMLGVRGLESLVASGRPDMEGGFAAAVLRGVDSHRFGQPQDDTLVVEVWRPVGLRE